MQIQIVRLVLATVLVVSAVITSLSPLNAEYAPAAWGVVALGAVLGLVVCMCATLRTHTGGWRTPVLAKLTLRPVSVILKTS